MCTHWYKYLYMHWIFCLIFLQDYVSLSYKPNQISCDFRCNLWTNEQHTEIDHSRTKYASTQFNSTSVKTSFSCFLFIVYWNACTYLANKYWLCCTVDYFSSYIISMSGSFEVVICLLIYLSQHLLNFCLEFSLFRYICVFYRYIFT